MLCWCSLGPTQWVAYSQKCTGTYRVRVIPRPAEGVLHWPVPRKGVSIWRRERTDRSGLAATRVRCPRACRHSEVRGPRNILRQPRRAAGDLKCSKRPLQPRTNDRPSSTAYAGDRLASRTSCRSLRLLMATMNAYLAATRR
jgi:hypothetical protein